MSRKRFLAGAAARPALICAFGALALFAGEERASAGDDLLHALKPISDSELSKPATDDWLMRRGNFAGWGYSALDQVNAQNVGRLKLAWAWNMELGYQEEAPLRITAYCSSPTPRTSCRRSTAAAAICCGGIGASCRRSRAAITTICLIAHAAPSRCATTKCRWPRPMLTSWRSTPIPVRWSGTPPWPINGRATRSQAGRWPPTAKSSPASPAAPIGYRQRVLHRRARRQDRRRGLAHQDDCAARFAGRRQLARPAGRQAQWRLGLDLRQLRSGAQSALLGHRRPDPHSEIVRGTGDGAVLYTDSTLALDADTGKIVWYHQFLPRDNWNLDHEFEQVLADIEVDGHPRQVLLTIGKPGIIWALDRRTGEFLWERETTYQTVYNHIDAETGQVALNESLIPQSSMRPNLFVRLSMVASCGWRAPIIRPQKRCSAPLNNLRHGL